MKMNSLSNLLTHEIVDLYSAEDQILQALPQMVDQAHNQELKKALKDHLRQTEQQKKRLEKVHKLIQQEDGSSDEELGDTTCMGMKGLIDEGRTALDEDMDADVKDAAIIACVQKIEHYEISGYGTACAFARELEMNEVEKILRQTLDEESDADEMLTTLAVGGVNMEAEGNINVRRLPAGQGNGRRTTSQRSSSRAASRAPGGSRRSNGARSGRTKKSATARGRKTATAKSRNVSSSASSRSSRPGNSSRSKSSRGR